MAAIIMAITIMGKITMATCLLLPEATEANGTKITGIKELEITGIKATDSTIRQETLNGTKEETTIKEATTIKQIKVDGIKETITDSGTREIKEIRLEVGDRETLVNIMEADTWIVLVILYRYDRAPASKRPIK